MHLHRSPRGSAPLVLFASICTVIVLSLSSCKRTEDTGARTVTATGGTTAPAATLTKVKIGYVGLTCDSDLFVAYEKGFFKDEGLEVEMVKMPWPDLSTALSLGKVD